jgi:hypothetical protein
MTGQSGRFGRRFRVGLAACVAFGLLLSGCASDDGDDVASLTGDEDTAQDAGNGAEELLACLKDAGLPAILSDYGDGKAIIDWEPEGHDIMVRWPNGGNSIPGKSGEIASEDEAAFWEEGQGDFGLWIDGVDHTDKWESCYTESGYVDPNAGYSDPAEELKQKQQLLEVTNAWIACARDNGYPEMPDATAVSDNWETMPEAVIPLETTVDQLNVLLDACPTFDAEEVETMINSESGPDPDSAPFANVRIEYPPGFDWASAQDPGAESSSPEYEHYSQLNEALYADLAAVAASAEATADPAPVE